MWFHVITSMYLENQNDSDVEGTTESLWLSNQRKLFVGINLTRKTLLRPSEQSNFIWTQFYTFHHVFYVGCHDSACNNFWSFNTCFDENGLLNLYWSVPLLMGVIWLKWLEHDDLNCCESIKIFWFYIGKILNTFYIDPLNSPVKENIFGCRLKLISLMK